MWSPGADVGGQLWLGAICSCGTRTPNTSGRSRNGCVRRHRYGGSNRTFHVAVENVTRTKLDYFVDVAISER